MTPDSSNQDCDRQPAEQILRICGEPLIDRDMGVLPNRYRQIRQIRQTMRVGAFPWSVRPERLNSI